MQLRNKSLTCTHYLWILFLYTILKLIIIFLFLPFLHYLLKNISISFKYWLLPNKIDIIWCRRIIKQLNWFSFYNTLESFFFLLRMCSDRKYAGQDWKRYEIFWQHVKEFWSIIDMWLGLLFDSNWSRARLKLLGLI